MAQIPLSQLADLTDVVGTDDVGVGDVVAAIVLAVLTVVLAGVASRVIRRWLGRPESESEEIAGLLARLARWGIIVVGFSWALSFVGVTLGWLALTVIAVLVGLVLVMKPQFEGLAAAIVITTRPGFDVGDEIEVLDQQGEIVDVTARSTILRQPDGRRVHIPNGGLLREVVTVISTAHARRGEIGFQVAEDEDLDRLEQLTLDAIGGLAHVLDDPSPVLLVRDLAGGAIDVSVRFWHESRIRSGVAATDEVVKALSRVYAAKGISTDTNSLAVTVQ